jgi:hypothetical protein
MPSYLRHKTRVTDGGNYIEELWDNGSNKRNKSGSFEGGGYLWVFKHGTKRVFTRPTYIQTQSGSLKYPNASFPATIPDRYQFPETFSGIGYDPATKTADLFGADAFLRMRPDKPNMSLLNAAFELRELPELFSRKLIQYKGLGKAWSNYYLAIEFGWLPLLGDIRDFTNTTFNLKKKLDQLLRDNGKPVRRQVTILDTSSSKVGSQGDSYAAMQSGLVSQTQAGHCYFRDTLEYGRKVWGSARFRFYLPDGPHDWRWTLAMYARIFGISPSPSVVWNAIPWSWLVDWYTNVGSVIKNFDYTVADRLAADYAFIMERKYYTYKRTVNATYWSGASSKVDVQATTELLSDSKNRSVIDPFGFALNPNSLTNRQNAILGALGLSRLPSLNGKY